MLEVLIPKPFREMFCGIASPPSRNKFEHPYEFIKRAYGSSFNSRLTGLPGYSPPWYVRVVNGVAYCSLYFVLVSAVMFVVSIVSTILVWGIETYTTVEFLVSVPFTGQMILEFESIGLSIVNTAVTLSFAVFCVSCWVMYALSWVSTKVSQSFEEDYEEWLEEIKPGSQTYYPEGLQYELYGDKTQYMGGPCSVPTAFRDMRRVERILALSKALLYVQFLLVLSIFWRNHMDVYKSVGTSSTEKKQIAVDRWKKFK